MSSADFPVWLIPIAFVALWLFVCALLSRISGWAVLANSFLLEGEFTGQKWRFERGVMRWGCKFDNVLTIGCNPRGLYLAILAPFRLGHPPLLIPWEQITVSTRRYFLFDYTQLTLGREERIPLLVRPALAARLSAAAGEHWPASVN